MSCRRILASLLVAPVLASAPVEAQTVRPKPAIRRIRIPAKHGQLSLLRFTRTILKEYGFAGEHVQFRDRYLDIDNLAGKLLLEGVSTAVRDSAEFFFDGKNLVIEIDPVRSRIVKNQIRRQLAAALGALTGIDVLKRHYALEVPRGLGKEETWVLCVHGVESTPAVFTDFRRYIQDRIPGLRTGTFGYANDEAIDRIGAQLSLRLRARAKNFPKQRIILVAHSMGGLISRFVLENRALDPGTVSTLIMLGTPNQGSKLARLRTGLDLLNILDARGTTAKLVAPLLDGLGEAGSDMVPGSSFLTTLNAKPRNPNVTYHLVLGNRGFVAGTQMQAIRGQLMRTVAKLWQHEIYEQKASRFLGSLDEVVSGKGDGAVSLERGKLAGVTPVVVPLNHMGLVLQTDLRSRQPAFEQVRKWILAARVK